MTEEDKRLSKEIIGKMVVMINNPDPWILRKDH
jgi:hypothetical protein